MVPKRKKAKIRREESGYTIVVDENALFLNKTAFFVYILCNGENTSEDIAKKISTYFNMDIRQVLKEIEQLLNDFKMYGLLQGFTCTKNAPLQGTPPAPLYVTWSITKQCNLSCKHCYINYEPEEVSSAGLMDILEKIKKIQPFFVVLTGGEPLLRKELFPIMDTLAMSEILLETNGTLINASTADALSARSPIVQVSIYSSCEKKHDFMTTVPGSFKKMMHGVALLRDRGVTVQFNCVLHKENIDEIQKITDLSLKHGDKIKFDILDLLGRGKNLSDSAFSIPEYKKIVTTIKELEHLEVCVHLPYMHIKDGVYEYDMSVCTAASTGLMINFDGTAVPCEKLPIPLGSVLENDISTVWNSELANRLRDLSCIKGKCASCTFLSRCRGGCRGEAYIRTGDLFSEDPLCWIQNIKTGTGDTT